jgi:dTDP-4-amino-4,6-dideoxygalactose transaminase
MALEIKYAYRKLIRLIKAEHLVGDTALLAYLKQRGIWAVFHYLPLHQSPYYAARHDGRALPWADHYAEHLIRLPLFYELTEADQRRITDEVLGFYQSY